MHEGLVLLQRLWDSLRAVLWAMVAPRFSVFKGTAPARIDWDVSFSMERFRVASPEGVLVTTQFATPSVMAGSGLKLQHSST